MSDTSEVLKLASLRAKTDQELVAIIESALERARDLVPRQPTESERACAEAARLLPAVRSCSERRRLELKLEDLRRSLAAPPARAVEHRAGCAH